MELPTKRHGGRFVRLPVKAEQYVLFLVDVIRVGTWPSCSLPY
jgi:polyphosphate kinase